MRRYCSPSSIEKDLIAYNLVRIHKRSPTTVPRCPGDGRRLGLYDGARERSGRLFLDVDIENDPSATLTSPMNPSAVEPDWGPSGNDRACADLRLSLRPAHLADAQDRRRRRTPPDSCRG